MAEQNIIFRLQKDSDLSNSIKHWGDSFQYKETQIGAIKSTNPDSTNEPTSIPSPFARIAFVQEFFPASSLLPPLFLCSVGFFISSARISRCISASIPQGVSAFLFINKSCLLTQISSPQSLSYVPFELCPK